MVLWAQTFDDLAITDRVTRMNLRLGNLKIMIVLTAILSCFSFAILSVSPTLPHRAALALGFVFFINTGAVAIFVAVVFCRTSFELQIDRFEVNRQDFPILTWFGVIELVTILCSIGTLPFFAWGISEVLAGINAFYILPVVAMGTMLVIAFFLPFLSLLPPSWTQRPSVSWVTNVPDTSEETLASLRYACANADWYAVDLLIKRKNADLNKTFDTTNSTLLHVATAKRYDFMVERLIAAKARVDVQNTNGDNPLHVAALCDDYKIIKIIVENGDATQVQAALQQKNAAGQTPPEIALARDIPIGLQKTLAGPHFV